MFFAFFYAKRVLARATKGSRDDKKPTDAGLTRVSGTSGVLSCNYRLFSFFIQRGHQLGQKQCNMMKAH